MCAPDFDTKMHEVFLVYKQIEILFDDNGELFIPAVEHNVHTYSYDEKSGIQAVSIAGKDLNPTTNCGTINRDYEYESLGTVSLLAAIDLFTGEAVLNESKKVKLLSSVNYALKNISVKSTYM